MVDRVKVIGAGADAVDFALVNLCQAGDVVITQDYGVAAMALGKRAYAMHRASGKHHLKGPRKRSEEDNLQFKDRLERLLKILLEQVDNL